MKCNDLYIRIDAIKTSCGLGVCSIVDDMGKLRAGGVGGVNPGHMMVKLLISILMPLFVGKVSP